MLGEVSGDAVVQGGTRLGCKDGLHTAAGAGREVPRLRSITTNNPTSAVQTDTGLSGGWREASRLHFSPSSSSIIRINRSTSSASHYGGIETVTVTGDQ